MGRERKTERWWALMFDYGKEQVRKEWRDGEQRSREENEVLGYIKGEWE